MKTLAFITAHYITQGIVDEYTKLEASGKDVLLFIDNKNHKFGDCCGEITIKNFYGKDVRCYFADFSDFVKLGLPGYYIEKKDFDYNAFMWYNADYPFYVIAHLLPNYDYYWRVEYDIYCNGDSYKPFFDQYEENFSDLLICRYRKAISKGWFALEKLNWAYDKKITIYESIFPLVRLSKRAVDYLYKRRQELEKIYQKVMKKRSSRWIYCEVFVPTEIYNNKKFTGEAITDQYIRPRVDMSLFKERLFLKPDNKLYHPVR